MYKMATKRKSSSKKAKKSLIRKIIESIFFLAILLFAIPISLDLLKQQQVTTNQAQTPFVCTTHLKQPFVSNSQNPSYPSLCTNTQSLDVASELASCGDYYLAWWCHPQTNTTQSDVLLACRGWVSPDNTIYRVDFRNRVNFIQDTLLSSQIAQKGDFEGRRLIWNKLITEINTNKTTFGLKDARADLDYAANKIFGKSWVEVKFVEDKNNCSLSL